MDLIPPAPQALWADKLAALGPLRLQSSEGDCAPTTVINALLYLSDGRIHPKLLRLIWAVSLDFQGHTTGWVGCQLLSEVVNAWAAQSANDGVAHPPQGFASSVWQGKAATAERIARAIGGGGAVCITCKDGKHYALLHSADGACFYGFDPYLPDKKNPLDGHFLGLNSPHAAPAHLHGMVNFSLPLRDLKALLKRKDRHGNLVNQWFQVIERTA